MFYYGSFYFVWLCGSFPSEGADKTRTSSLDATTLTKPRCRSVCTWYAYRWARPKFLLLHFDREARTGPTPRPIHHQITVPRLLDCHQLDAAQLSGAKDATDDRNPTYEYFVEADQEHHFDDRLPDGSLEDTKIIHFTRVFSYASTYPAASRRVKGVLSAVWSFNPPRPTPSIITSSSNMSAGGAFCRQNDVSLESSRDLAVNHRISMTISSQPSK